MKTSHTVVIAILFIASIFSARLVADDTDKTTVVLGTFDYPPLMIQENHNNDLEEVNKDKDLSRGIGLDFVRRAFKNHPKYKLEIKYFPVKQAMAEFIEGRTDIFLGSRMDVPSIANDINAVRILPLYSVLFCFPENCERANNRGSANGLGTISSIRGSPVNKLLMDKGNIVEAVNTLDASFNLLLAGRVDYVAAIDFAGYNTVQRKKLLDSRKIVQADFDLMEISYDAVVRKDNEKAKIILEALRNELDYRDTALDAIPLEERLAILQKWGRSDTTKVQTPSILDQLTREERAWLEKHPEIIVAYEGNFAPYSLQKPSGGFEGAIIDYMELVAEQLGIRINIYPKGAWNDLYEAAKRREVDVVSTLTHSPEREQWFAFTRPYLEMQVYIVTRKGDNAIRGKEDLTDRVVALVRGYWDAERIVSEYPTIKPLYMDSLSETMQAVADGRADATLAPIGIGQYSILKQGFVNLKMTVPVASYKGQISLGVRKDWPELVSILNKADAAIPEKQKLTILDNWISGFKPPGAPLIDLTSEEKQWLDAHPSISMCVDPAWMPFEQINNQGEHEGIIADYIALFSKRLGVEFKLHPTKTYVESVEKVSSGECLLLSSWGAVPGKEDPGLSTKGFMPPLVDVLAVRMDMPFISQHSDLAGLRIGVVAGYPGSGNVRQSNPGAEIVLVDSVDDGVRDLSNGTIDVFVDTQTTIGYSIQKQNVTNVKVGGAIPGAGSVPMLVNRYEPDFRSILDKAIDSITQEERQRVANKWIAVRIERGFDYSLMWKLSLGFLLVLAAILAWNHVIRRQKAALAESEARLQESERNLRDIIERMPIAACLLNNKGEFYYRNRRFGELVGWKEEEVPTLAEWWPKAYPDKDYRKEVIETWGNYVRLSAEQGTDISADEYRVTCQDGQVRELEISGIVLGDGYLATLIDHTEQNRSRKELKRAKESAEAANQAKSTFLANMSHELRTPLNAILGFSEMLAQDQEASTEQKTKLAIINRSGEHLLSMINDVLDLSKIEAGSTELELAGFNLPQMLQDIGRMLAVRAESAGLSFELQLDPALPQYIETDSNKLRQIIINLLGNALKFTDEGGCSLHVRTQTIEDNAILCQLQLEVEDSGPGIAADQLESIFEPFIQGQHGQGTKGTGLGLAITKSLVELLGGKISVQSQPEKGSLFRVELPVALAEKGDDIEPISPPVLSLEPDQPKWRILVAEDNATNRLLLWSLLLQVGFEVREVENGKEAVAQFTQWQPHLILMDIRMPVMDGLEAAQKIRKLPGGNEVKIVAVTASVFNDQKDEVMKAGFDDFMRKPYKREDIFGCIAKHLSVRYIREQEEKTVADKVNIQITAEMLAQLPNDAITELRNAIIALDMEQTNAVLDQLSGVDPELISALKQLVENMDFRALKSMLGFNNKENDGPSKQ